MAARIILTLALAGWIAVATYAAPAGPASVVRFDLDDRGAIEVPVTIGAAGPFRFVLDTGSNGSAVSERVAIQLGLRPVARAAVLSPAGRRMAGVVRLTGVAVGCASIPGLLATVHAAEELTALVAGTDGVLGQDFLGRFTYTLDYRRKLLTWDELGTNVGRSAAEGVADASDPVPVRLVAEDGRLVAELPQSATGRTLRIVPDSGSETLVFFERPLSRLPQMTSLGNSRRLVGMTGERDARMVRVHALEVGSLTLRDQLAVALRRAEPEAPDVDGLLPLHQFARVRFDRAQGRLLIWP